MVDGSILRTLFVATLLASSVTFAQDAPPPPEPSSAGREPSLGEAISVPRPELSRRKRRRYETPELPGTSVVTGSHLVDGSLPWPLIDYYSRAGNIVQRVSIFSNGVVSITLDGAGANVRKRVRIPMGAVENYAAAISRADLERVPVGSLRVPDAANVSFIRISNGADHVERRYHTHSIIPGELQRQRGILEDLLRVLAEDREVSSPLANYEPKMGDRLISDDAKTYEVTKLSESPESGLIVELTCTREPVKMYVAAKDLYNYFVATKARAPE